jgi:hypothetical protein
MCFLKLCWGSQRHSTSRRALQHSRRVVLQRDVLMTGKRFRLVRQLAPAPGTKTGEESPFDARSLSGIVAGQPFDLQIVSRP